MSVLVVFQKQALIDSSKNEERGEGQVSLFPVYSLYGHNIFRLFPLSFHPCVLLLLF